jgi:hypothetical protein
MHGLILLVSLAAAQSPGWTKQGSSMLLYDSSSTVVMEVPLGRWEEPVEGGVSIAETQGEVSASRRFALTIKTRTLWNPTRTKKRDFRAELSLLSNTSVPLWDELDLEPPVRGAAALFDASGETLILCRHAKEGSFCALKGYLGNTLAESGPWPRVLELFVTPNGRYGYARWDVPDKSATHTFFDALKKRTKDVDSSEFPLAVARLEDDGKVYAGKKLVLDLGAEEKKP